MKYIMLLPPFAVSRIGSADEPVVNFDLVLKESAKGEPKRKQIVPAETIFVEKSTGRVKEIRVAEEKELNFKDPVNKNKIRPVAPFFEVWAQFENEDEPRIITQDDVTKKSLKITWSIELGNFKAYRRTQSISNDPANKIVAKLLNHPHEDGTPQPLNGKSSYFLTPTTTIPLGWFQCLLTDDNHKEIRARFIPPHGKIYGPPNSGDPKVVPVLKSSSPWVGFDGDTAPDFPLRTVPQGTYAGEERESSGIGYSRGFLDDTSEGVISVNITGPEIDMTAKARVTIAPPHFGPDRLIFRSLQDDFEYLEFGAEVSETVPDQYVVDLIEKTLDSAELIQLEWSKRGSNWNNYLPNTPPLDPDDARQEHIFLLSDARKLVDEFKETGVFRKREDFVDAIRSPASLEGGLKMPLFMVGQNRRPLWFSPLQYAKLKKWATQKIGEKPVVVEIESSEISPEEARNAMLNLIRVKRDDENAARRHRRVRIGDDDRRLSELFDEEENLLEYLLTKKAIRVSIPELENELLITPGNLDKSVFYQLIIREEGIMNGVFEDDEIKIVERWIMSLKP